MKYNGLEMLATDLAAYGETALSCCRNRLYGVRLMADRPNHPLFAMLKAQHLDRTFIPQD